MKLRRRWDEHAEAWTRWARAPGHDVHFWAMNLPALVALLPDPGGRTLDLGCGEGRFTRHLARLGHHVVGLDGSPLLVRGAAESGSQAVVGDAHRLPFRSGTFDLVVASMTLQDLDDLDTAVGEAGRVLAPGGVLCAAFVHPMSSALEFETENVTLSESYFLDRHYVSDADRDGLRMSFASVHRPLSAYTSALEMTGFVIEALREPRLPESVVSRHPNSKRFRLIPPSLHLRARKT